MSEDVPERLVEIAAEATYMTEARDDTSPPREAWDAGRLSVARAIVAALLESGEVVDSEDVLLRWGEDYYGKRLELDDLITERNYYQRRLEQIANGPSREFGTASQSASEIARRALDGEADGE